jgi:hypothetical protein
MKLAFICGRTEAMENSNRYGRPAPNRRNKHAIDDFHGLRG